jgi:RNA-binding protein
MLPPLSNSEIRRLKASAQRLKAMLKMGRQGLSPGFLKTVDDALSHHELVKVKFDEFKDQRKTLAPQMAAQTRSHLVTLLGHVAVLYRPKATPENSPRHAASSTPSPSAQSHGTA